MDVDARREHLAEGTCHSRMGSPEQVPGQGRELGRRLGVSKQAAGKDAKAAPPPANKGEAQKQSDQAKEDVSLRALIPAFMISELRRAFEIGFPVADALRRLGSGVTPRLPGT